MKKRPIAMFVLVLALLLALPNLSVFAETALPIVEEPVTYNVLVKGNTHTNTNELLSMIELEKRTNVTIHFDDIPGSMVTERVTLAFASGDLPDAFMRCNLSPELLVQQNLNGNVINIGDYLDAMPNFKHLFENDSMIRGLCPQPDGKILSMPQITEVPGSLVVNKFFINKTWLDALGLSMPTTLDELYEVFIAFRDGDPNGNGEADEIAWTTSANLYHMILAYRGAFGLGNGGSWERFDHNPDDPSQLRFLLTAPEMKDVFTFLNKLYTENLMMPTLFEGSTVHGPQWSAAAVSNQLGSFNEIHNTFAGDYSDDYVSLDEAIEGPGGKMWTGNRLPVLGQGAFVVTSAAKNPDILLKWIDYFYSLEGAQLYFLGIEGETYEPAGDGLNQYTEEYRIPPAGYTFDQSVGRVTLYPGGNNPAYCFEEAYGGGDNLPTPRDACIKMEPYMPAKDDLIPSSYNLTAADSEIVQLYNADIKPIIEEAIAEFVTGRRPLSEYDNYVQEVEKAGLAQYTEVMQRAYDTYLANMGK